MVRIPLGNEKRARVEVRSVAPDANPYMMRVHDSQDRPRRARSTKDDEQEVRAPASCRTTSTTRSASSRAARSSKELFGEDVHEKFAELKTASAPSAARKALGTMVKAAEVQFHHEVTNQYLWNQF